MESSKTQADAAVRPNGRQENNESATSSGRIDILKTYKIYVDGKFPRTESGRYYVLTDPQGKQLANICLSSRKDFRDAVVAARKAQTGWASRSAYNRGQILYRIAEVMEGRKIQFVEELVQQGASRQAALDEVGLSIDRLVYYAGWCDKYVQVFSSVNPVESSHFNFSIPEPTGVIAIIAAEETGLAGLVSTLAPAIAGGNSVVMLASETRPLCAITLAEVIQTSDVPAGVVNILTGNAGELHGHFSSHMDVNAIVYCRQNADEARTVQTNAATNVKRSFIYSDYNWMSEQSQSPYLIMDLQEIKTTWHPIGQ